MEDKKAFDYYNRFDDYLKGELGHQEKQQLEEELSVDSELQNEFELFKMSIDVVQVSAMKKAVMEAQQRFRASESSMKNTRGASTVSWALRIAAGLLVLTLSYGVMQFSFVNSAGLYESLYTAYQLPVTRSSHLNYTHLDSLYLHQDYDKVIMHYDKLEHKATRDYFITAMAAMELDHYERAIELFQTLRSENENKKADARLFEQETDYYLALSHLKNGNYQQALLQFQRIKEDHSHLYNSAVSGQTILKLQVLQWKD